MNDLKGKNWATIIYPESAPADFVDVIKSWHIECLLSPLHDRDYTEDGVLKKEHYHLIVRSPATLSQQKFKQLYSDLVGGVGAEVVRSWLSYGRYLCHLDDPDKTQYSPLDVSSFSAGDYVSLFVDSYYDKYKELVDIQGFISDRHCTFSSLLSFAQQNKPEWVHVIIDNVYFINSVINSYKALVDVPSDPDAQSGFEND